MDRKRNKDRKRNNVATMMAVELAHKRRESAARLRGTAKVSPKVTPTKSATVIMYLYVARVSEKAVLTIRATEHAEMHIRMK